MKRYTAKQLEKDIEQLNTKLAEKNHEYRFMVGYRYNYTAIDLATTEQMARGCCSRMLVGGTPRQCLSECYAYIVANT